MKTEEGFYILWGNGDWEWCFGPLENAINRAKDAYWNYGHTGARIVQANVLYEVKDQMKETTNPK